MNPIPYLCRVAPHIRAAVLHTLDRLQSELAVALSGVQFIEGQNRRLKNELAANERQLHRQRELNMWLITRGFEFGCRGNWINHERDTHNIGIDYSLNKSMSMEPPEVIMRHADKVRLGVSVELSRDSFTFYERAARRADLAQCYLDMISATVQQFAQPAMLDLLGMPEEAEKLRAKLDAWRKRKP